MRILEIGVSSASEEFWLRTPEGRSIRFGFSRGSMAGIRGELDFQVGRVAETAHDWHTSNFDKLESLRKLANAGNAMFAELTTRLSSESPGQLNRLRSLARDQLVSADVISVTPECQIPWEMLYVGSNPDTPEIENFLGYRVVVRRQLRPASTRGSSDWEFMGSGRPISAILADAIGRDPRESITLVEDDALTSCRYGSEQDVFRHLNIGFEIVETVCDATEAKLRISEKSKSSVLVHFNCNGNRSERAGKAGEIQVSQNVKISHELLSSIPFQAGSLVVLNVCHSCQVSDFSEKSVVHAISDKEVAAIVGPMHKIEDQQSTDFAKELYRALFVEGMTIGAALVDARKAVLAQSGNPAVLLYTFFGDQNRLLMSA